jgi:hypothetical protein
MLARVTTEQIARLQQKAEQHQARLQAAKARLAEIERKRDTRRKIILGGLLLDAAAKDAQWEKHLRVLLARIDRPNDKEPFEGWSLVQYRAEGGKLGDRKRGQFDPEQVTETEAAPAEAESEATPERQETPDAAD